MHILLSLYFLIISYSSYANDDIFYLNKLNNCKITTPSLNDYEPEIFPTSNDLLRADFSKKRITTGEKIIIRGIVLDENCAPISDAKVLLWQVGTDKKYHYKPLKNKINQDLIKDDSEQNNFIGAGSTITNNQGEFYFITVKPPSINKKSPSVNIRIMHKDFSGLDTRLIISEYNLGKSPVEIRSDFIPLLKSYTLYDFQIVMKGEGILQY